MDFYEAFAKIKKNSKNFDCKNYTKDFAIQFNMTDPDCGGAFYAEYRNGNLRIEPYDYRDSDAEVTTDFKHTEKLFSSKLSPADAAKNNVFVTKDTDCFTMFFNGLKKKTTSVKKATVKSASKKHAKP